MYLPILPTKDVLFYLRVGWKAVLIVALSLEFWGMPFCFISLSLIKAKANISTNPINDPSQPVYMRYQCLWKISRRERGILIQDDFITAKYSCNHLIHGVFKSMVNHAPKTGNKDFLREDLIKDKYGHF